MVSKRKTNAFGFPIKDFGNDKKGRSSPLNGSITPCSSPRQSSSRGPWFLKIKRRRKNLDSRLKISGMTEKKVVIPERFYHPLFVTPECFYQGSTVFKKHGCLTKFQA